MSEGPTGAFRAAFRNPALRRLGLAWTSSTIGAWAFTIAIAVYAYQAGGASLVAVMTVVRLGPAAIAGPFAGNLADRISRRRVMVVAEAVRALALAGCAAAIAADVPTSFVFAIAGVFTIAQTAFRPAQAALLPGLARTPAELAASNVALNAIESAGFLVGSTAAGILVATTSVATVCALTAVALGISTLVLVGVPRDARPEPAAGGAASGSRAALAQAFAGVSTIAGDERQRIAVTLLGGMTFVEGALEVLMVVAAIELLGLGEAGVGWLNTAWGVGGVAGGVAAVAVIARRGLAGGLVGGSLVFGAGVALVGAAPVAAVALGAFVVAGVGYALIEIAGITLMQRLGAEDVLARIFGTLESVSVATLALGAALAPAAIELLGIEGALLAFGALLPVVAAARLRRLAQFAAEAPVPGRPFELLRGLSIFSPLPLMTVEQLARSMDRVEYGAGVDVITEGESGDLYYVIDSGEVEVFEQGEFRRVQGPGEAFGEIALLRDVPRTATVRSLTPLSLYSMERDNFIAGATGHARSTEAAEAVITSRLGRLGARP